MRNSIIASIVFLFLPNCATNSAKVIQYLSDEMNYADYHTYKLINYKSADKSYAKEGLALFNDVEKSITKNMTKKKYRVASKADLIVRYEIVSTTTSQTRTSQNNAYNSSYNNSNALAFGETKKTTEGVILIEFRDRKLQKLVWQGSLDLKYSKNQDASITLEESIDRIFTTYPYVAGSAEMNEVLK